MTFRQRLPLLRYVLLSVMMAGIVSCQSEKPTANTIDTSYRSSKYGERIRFIVVHYTATDNAASLNLLTEGDVSTHYLILQGNHPIYQLVPDHKAAWHAGQSSFRGLTNINDNSIGIEIANEGVHKRYRQHNNYHPYHHYVAYEERQIQQVGMLIKQLATTYNINPRNIVAHSDIAPSRKSDPGAKFPWERLYRNYGVGAWYEEGDKNAFMQEPFDNVSVNDMKSELRRYGYTINDSDTWDKSSRDVVYAFQLHFNPKNATGEMDQESYAILKALNKKYVHKE